VEILFSFDVCLCVSVHSRPINQLFSAVKMLAWHCTI